MKILYLIYQIVAVLAILLPVTVIAAILCIAGSIFNDRFWGYWPGMVWGRVFLWVLLIPIKVNGRENIEKGQSYIIVSNHQSMFDVFALYGFLGVKFKWMMKKELGRIPFVGWACRAAGHIFVDRESAFHSVDSMNRAKRKLSGGMSLMIFPEGTRTADGSMGRFKRGAFQIACDMDLPILPITLDGCFDIMSRKDWHVTWHPITMTIHKPVHIAVSDENRNAAIREAADMVSVEIGKSLKK